MLIHLLVVPICNHLVPQVEVTAVLAALDVFPLNQPEITCSSVLSRPHFIQAFSLSPVGTTNSMGSATCWGEDSSSYSTPLFELSEGYSLLFIIIIGRQYVFEWNTYSRLG